MVISSKNGQQLDITMRLRDNTGRMVTYQGRKSKGSYNHAVKGAGDYEICFNNRHAMVDSKLLVWEFDIQGDEEIVQPAKELEIMVNQTMEEYKIQADSVNMALKKVRFRLTKAKSTQWWLGMKTPKDTERLESIVKMIDTWSMAYSCLIVLVGIIQLFVLKRLFNEKPTTSKLNARI